MNHVKTIRFQQSYRVDLQRRNLQNKYILKHQDSIFFSTSVLKSVRSLFFHEFRTKLLYQWKLIRIHINRQFTLAWLPQVIARSSCNNSTSVSYFPLQVSYPHVSFFGIFSIGNSKRWTLKSFFLFVEVRNGQNWHWFKRIFLALVYYASLKYLKSW